MQSSLPRGYKMSDGLESLGKENVTHRVSWASKMLLTTPPEHDEKEVKRIWSLSEASGVSDGHPPSSSSSPNPLLGTPLGGKGMLVLVRRAIPAAFQLYTPP